MVVAALKTFKSSAANIKFGIAWLSVHCLWPRMPLKMNNIHVKIKLIMQVPLLHQGQQFCIWLKIMLWCSLIKSAGTEHLVYCSTSGLCKTTRVTN